MLRLLGRILAAQGVTEVATFTDAKAALEAILGTPIADGGDAVPPAATASLLVISDLNMPGMDGVEFIRHLAERGFTGCLVLLSGEDERLLKSAEALVRAHRLRLLGCLAKPVSPGALARILVAWQNSTNTRPEARRPAPAAVEPTDLRAALEQGWLELHYQPKVALADGAVVGCEALVRLNHPQHGLVFPDRFIPLAEAHRLICALTRQVVVKALSQAARWQAEGRMLTVSVNVTMDDLKAVDFADFVVNEARRQGVVAERVMLEITESRAMSEIRQVLDVLTRLRLKRIGLSIDDFGTGYSSLTQLHDLPFNELKIDRGFVHRAHHDASRRAIVEASVELARKFGMKIVAEGVEDEAGWRFIRAAGIDMAQGYFIAKPMPAEQFTAWLADWERRMPRHPQT